MPQPQWSESSTWMSNPFVTFEKAFIEEDEVFGAKEPVTLLVDANRQRLADIQMQRVCLFDGLVEPANPAFDFVLVGLDDQPAEQLIELVLNPVLFLFTHLNAEFHSLLLTGLHQRRQPQPFVY